MKNLINRALVGQQAKFCLGSFIGVLILLASCNLNDPKLKEVTPETSLEALLAYFPYSLDEEFIFFNDSLNQRIEAKAYDEYKDGLYPETSVEGQDANSEWKCSVRAFLFNSHINPDSVAWTHYGVEDISAYIAHHPSEEASPIEMTWRVALRLDVMNGIIASSNVHCEKSELISLLTDTITLPVRTIFSYDNKMDTTVMEGSCVHIVRNVGIVDFTLDGKTYWRRVKE